MDTFISIVHIETDQNTITDWLQPLQFWKQSGFCLSILDLKSVSCYTFITKNMKHKWGCLSTFHCIKVGQQRKYIMEEDDCKLTLTVGALFDLGSDLTAWLQFSIFFS